MKATLKKSDGNQAGFGLIGAIAIIVVVLAIAASGALVYVRKQQADQKNAVQPIQPTPGALYEPVIYLYPPHSEKVDVTLSYAAGLSKSVPLYNTQSGWSVEAQPGGTLTNLADGKKYPYLLWEGNPAPLNFDMTKGFVVSGSQTKAFLESQLPVIGLNQKETDEFIAYWLPKMQGNRYNLIHFAGNEYTSYAKLSVTPKPDSLLRVLMAFEPLQEQTKVTPQSFPVFHRAGFTVVEWGGTELH